MLNLFKRKPKEIKIDKWHNFLPKGYWFFGTEPNVRVYKLKRNPISRFFQIRSILRAGDSSKYANTPCQCINVLNGKPASQNCPICEEFRKGKK